MGGALTRMWLSIALIICLACTLKNVSGMAQIGGCRAKCSSDSQCEGQLACMKGVCNDDPSLHTHNICGNVSGSCGSRCSSDGCNGRLACMKGMCGDDPEEGTNICNSSGPPAGSCGTKCSSNDECKGQLACIKKTCSDDPELGTKLCNTLLCFVNCSPSNV